MPEIDWDALDRIYTAQSSDSRFRELDSTLVPGEGDNPIAFIIGEAPGAQEVMQRRPFVGPAGRVQRQLMSFAGLWAAPELSHSREEGCSAAPNCWLTNAVKFYPPKRGSGRKPYWHEISAARDYLQQEWIAVGRPQLIIPVGGVALSAVAGQQVSIIKLSGKPIRRSAPYGRQGYTWVWPMLHPSFGLRQPAMRELIERDWEKLADWMRSEGYPG